MWTPKWSEVQAKVGQGLATILGIKDTWIFPPRIDLEGIVCVWDTGQGGFTNLDTWHGQVTGLTSLVGVASLSREVAAPEGIANSAYNYNSKNLRASGGYIILSFDAAGAAAFAGKKIVFQYSLFSVTDNFEVICGKEEETVVAAQTGYRVPFKGLPGTLIPNTFRLRFTIVSADATVFPANTTFQYGATGVEQAINGRVPL